MAWLLVGPGDVDLERAEARRERLHLRRVETLRREPQYPVFAECLEDRGEFGAAERLREIKALDRGAERLCGRRDDHRGSPTRPRCNSATRARAPGESGPFSIARAAISNCSSVAIPIRTVEIA